MAGTALALVTSFLTACQTYDTRYDHITAEPYEGRVSKQAIIEMDGVCRLVSLRYIAETGNIPNSNVGECRQSGINFGPFQYIDWDKEDAFTDAIELMKTQCEQDVKRDVFLRTLCLQPDWDREDRVMWEIAVSRIVSDRVAKTKGFEHYRTSAFTNGVERTICLNDLSTDIENGSQGIEYDCEQQAVVEGMLLQHLEDAYLSPDSACVLKRPFVYYLASGEAMNIPCPLSQLDGGNWHAFVISSATAVIFEATLRFDHDTEPENIDKKRRRTHCYETVGDYRIEDFIAGKPFIGFRSTAIVDKTGWEIDMGPFQPKLFKSRISSRAELADIISALVSVRDDELLMARWEARASRESDCLLNPSLFATFIPLLTQAELAAIRAENKVESPVPANE